MSTVPETNEAEASANAKKHQMSITLLTTEEVFTTLGIGRGLLWTWCKKGLFPKSINYTAKTKRWLLSEVDAIAKSLVRGDSDEARIALARQLEAARKVLA